MKILDLYSGVGGGSDGLRNAGYEPAFACEADRFACVVYRANFSCRVERNISIVDTKQVPHPEIIFASPPSQDPQQIVRFLNETQPRAVILEYPERLMNRKLFGQKRTVNFGDYKCWYETLNTNDYGLPQKRKVFYLVGFRKDVKMITEHFTFPEATSIGKKLETILEKNPSKELFFSKEKIESILLKNKRNKEAGTGFKNIIYGPNDITQSLPLSYHKDYRGILIDNGQGVRRLSVLEAKRLMGFKDDFKLPASSTMAYKLLAQASCPPIVQAIGQEIKLWLI